MPIARAVPEDADEPELFCAGGASRGAGHAVPFAAAVFWAALAAHHAGRAGRQERLAAVFAAARARALRVVVFEALLAGVGGERNAPPGRPVIGGLVLVTFATLFFVPVVCSVLRKRDGSPVLM